MFGSAGKRLLPMFAGRFGARTGAPAGLMNQVRSIHPITGPPKYPITGRETWVLGVGFIIAIMIIPTWGLFSVPAWVEEHNRTD